MMKEEGAKRVRSVGDGKWEVDRLTSLPDCLLFQILLNLPTKDVVKTSVLSSRWRNVWRSVPRLNLDDRDFGYDYKALMSFSDRFLAFNTESASTSESESESSLQIFSLIYGWNSDDKPDSAQFSRLINIAVERRVQRLNVFCRPSWFLRQVEVPPTVYTCESLVSLVLGKVALPEPSNSVVTLPCVKSIRLSAVTFPNDSAFEMLISGCPLLECLTLGSVNVKSLRVFSQSLLRFTLSASGCGDEDVAVAIDAPKLEYLQLRDFVPETSTLSNLGSLVTVDMVIECENPHALSKRDMVRNFLSQISAAKNMFISTKTLKFFYDYLRCQQPLPQFRNLSFIYATVFKRRMLPILLESCPNLKSLVLLDYANMEDEISGVTRHGCFSTSLEYVEMKRPTRFDANAMKLVGYFLENAAILRKLTLRLASDNPKDRKDDSVILEELRAIPKLSNSCQIEIISVPCRTFLRR